MCLSAPLQAAESEGWKGEAELGVVITSGNTDQTNINGRAAIGKEVEKWRHDAEARSLYSEADGNTTAEKYRVQGETDYKFTETHYWFLHGNYENERFSGYDFQASLTTGYGNRVWASGERSFLDLSAGLGYRFSKLEEAGPDGDRDEDEPIGRLAAHLDYELSETALFRQVLSTEIGLDEGDTVTESETALQAKINSALSMKVAYLVKHRSDVPPETKKTDTEFILSLLYGF